MSPNRLYFYLLLFIIAWGSVPSNLIRMSQKIGKSYLSLSMYVHIFLDHKQASVYTWGFHFPPMRRVIPFFSAVPWSSGRLALLFVSPVIRLWPDCFDVLSQLSHVSCVTFLAHRFCSTSTGSSRLRPSRRRAGFASAQTSPNTASRSECAQMLSNAASNVKIDMFALPVWQSVRGEVTSKWLGYTRTHAVQCFLRLGNVV